MDVNSQIGIAVKIEPRHSKDAGDQIFIKQTVSLVCVGRGPDSEWRMIQGR